jgi:hypothetical protein
MKVQKFVNGSWEDKQIVIDDLANETLRMISEGQHLTLDTVWLQEGAYTPTISGSYRVYAALLDEEGNILQTSENKKLEDYYEFQVI